MRVTSKRMLLPAVAAALLGAVGAGCSVGDDDGGDKAGGRRADGAAACGGRRRRPAGRTLRAQVRLPGGQALQARCVRVVGTRPVKLSYEAQIAQLVRDGEFALGWMGARSWDG